MSTTEDQEVSSGGLLVEDVRWLFGALGPCLTDAEGAAVLPEGATVEVDLGFHKVHVILNNAKVIEPRLREILERWPERSWGQENAPLEKGPSYIHIGGVVEDQGQALRLMAIGEALGFWKVITPRTLGITDDEEVKRLCGGGLVMVDGYKR